jgi:aminopeptidase N
MKFVYLILFTFVFINLLYSKNDYNQIQNEISLPTKYINQDFDVLSYDATINFIDIPNKLVQGVNIITFRWVNRTDSSKFYFHLRGLKIDSIFYNNNKTNWKEVGDTTSASYHFEIIPPVNEQSDTAKITIVYSGQMTNEGGKQPWGGVHYQDTLLFALGVGFLNNYVSTTQHWLPCYDHPSDKALFKCNFIVPSDYYVVSNGDVIINNLPNQITEFKYSLKEPAATYLLTFNIGKLTSIQFDGASVPIKVYADPRDTIAARYAFKLTPRMLNYFSSICGDYPFETFGYVLTPKGSMESQTMVNYYKPLVYSSYSQKDSVNLTAAHEMSHQWFGDMVTPLDYRDVWLNESFATYSESLWKEHLFGFSSNLNEQRVKMSKYFNNIVKLEGVIPLWDFPRTMATTNYPVTIYYKGAVVLGMLRYKLGDTDFFRILKAYLKKYKYNNLNTSDLKDNFEKEAGASLTTFFDQWIYGKGWPKIKVNVQVNDAPENKKTLNNIIIEQEATNEWGIFLDLPINLTIKKLNGEIIDTVITLNGTSKQINFDNFLLDTVLVNNGNKVVTLMQLTGYKVEHLTSVSENIKRNINYKLINKNLELNIPEIYQRTEIKFFDLLGKEIFSEKNENANDIFINLQNLKNGFYTFIILCDNQLIYSNKILLQ